MQPRHDPAGRCGPRRRRPRCRARSAYNAATRHGDVHARRRRSRPSTTYTVDGQRRHRHRRQRHGRHLLVVHHRGGQPPPTCPCSIWRPRPSRPRRPTPTPRAVEVGRPVPLRRRRAGHRRPVLQGQRQHRHARRPPVEQRPARCSATVTFTGETASGWQQATFATPVAITANTTYVVSYYAPERPLRRRHRLLRGVRRRQRPAARAAGRRRRRQRRLPLRHRGRLPDRHLAVEQLLGRPDVHPGQVEEPTCHARTRSPAWPLVAGRGSARRASLALPVPAARDPAGQRRHLPVLDLGRARPRRPRRPTPDTAAVELGVKFRSDVDGYVTGVRFYKGTGNTGTHVGHLWSATGTNLGTVTFTGETRDRLAAGHVRRAGRDQRQHDLRGLVLRPERPLRRRRRLLRRPGRRQRAAARAAATASTAPTASTGTAPAAASRPTRSSRPTTGSTWSSTPPPPTPRRRPSTGTSPATNATGVPTDHHGQRHVQRADPGRHRAAGASPAGGAAVPGRHALRRGQPHRDVHPERRARRVHRLHRDRLAARRTRAATR